MFQVIKNQGKTVEAHCLGAEDPQIAAWIAEGRIRHLEDGSYEVFSQEAVNGKGQLAQPGDYVKVDGAGVPYPNRREFFLENHRQIGPNLYEQLPQPLWAWSAAEPMCDEIRFLQRCRGLVLNEGDPERYFSAPLWGTVLSAAKDAVLVFYSITRDSAGEVVDADFNFVENHGGQGEFSRMYRVIG